MIKTLTSQDLAAFAEEVMTNPATRRKLVVQLRGAAEAARAAAATGESPAEAQECAAAAAAVPLPPAVTASGEAPVEGAATGAGAAAAGGGDVGAEELSVINDVFEFRGSCEAYPRPNSVLVRPALGPPPLDAAAA